MRLTSSQQQLMKAVTENSLQLEKKWAVAYRRNRKDTTSVEEISFHNLSGFLRTIEENIKDAEQKLPDGELKGLLLDDFARQYHSLGALATSLPKEEKKKMMEALKSRRRYMDYAAGRKYAFVRKAEKVIGFENVFHMLYLRRSWLIYRDKRKGEEESKLLQSFKNFIRFPLVMKRRREEAKRIMDTDYCLPYIEMRITTRCNMKCRHCAHLIPSYGQNAGDMTFEEFKKHFDHLINAISYIKFFSLVGGETPLSRHLPDIVKYVLECHKVGEIRIVSNGKEVPSEDLLELVENTRVVMHFSQYEMNKENYPVIRDLCQKYHVQTVFYHDEPSKQFWYDYGEIKDYHHTKMMMACTSYDCFLDGVKQYVNGKLFQCPRLSNAYDLGLIDLPQSDLLEITDDVEESRKNLRKFYRRSYSYGCRYCNAPAKKKVKMAEQLE